MPVDIDKAQEKVQKASGFFDTLNAFIKKHPIWTLIIVAVLIEGGHLSWLFGHEEESTTEYYEEPYYDEEYYSDEYADTTYYDEQLQYSDQEY